ncbi:golgin subfamily A member 1 isoform X1 [Canis lupus baileyi]|uniref:Golgin subfamily A member 1 n=3 Tax=Canis lupus TaxID=9612 RepID=A0A8C0MDD9_CANLF|nr:golgin subfamily A member 1 isoform X1 [Canis lupus familiaris]XP_005625425.1 golgin subfamily A member 1 isoform X1 [Canis lupus familiaris]XP_005625426.1 golgin subfamily A member 1 isoform X1 [Canis lupus familiaris]XP_025330905.3 golgin subfamily A member 1 isoform X1 [Canis lupus dingo]XP_025330907.3 golgin subfamily A member 1 isoform X1 [Canis lupus dingo]XP_025330908.3 golgin subfamily A member 1 isoform X1 [Canis lupus dingo]XP_025330909.3 golgin subfamily A member 1 isoform X1 [C|eukprot:XP_005625424.1 golgin subfamily A member 1 isoform X1 [Canis lupus familiaris]
MFAKLKKKIAEETAVSQRPGGATRIPRSVSKESVASMGADSGDDFASDGSSSREDLSSQLLRRNEQIRKLEARLSDYAEQVRNLQKIKEKLEIALEKHQDSSMRKFQEQNETFQANRAKMAEGLALALARKDQEWSEKMDQLEKEKRLLTAQLQEVKNQSLNLFQRRDEMDELEGFQQQELSKVKHMLLKKEETLGKTEQELEARTRELSHTREELMTSSQMLSDLSQKLEELQRHCSALEEQRDHVTASKTGAENKISALVQKEQELQAFIQQLSMDLQKATAKTQEKEKLVTQLQEKVSSLEKRLEQNLSGEEHVQELLKEKTVAEQNLEDTRQQLLAARSSQAKAIDILETRVKELQQNLQASEEKLKHSGDVMVAQEVQIQELAAANQESSRIRQQALALEQQCTERVHTLEAQLAALERARVADHTAAEQEVRKLEQENAALRESKNECERSLQHHQLELKKLKEEWSQREIVSVAMAQALEEVRKQREEFQRQAANLTAVVDEKEQTLQERAEVILQKEQEIFQLKKGHDSVLLQTRQLQSELEALQSLRGTTRDEELRLPSPEQGLTRSVPEPLVTSRATQDPTFQLSAAEGVPNGEVGVMDLEQLQKDKQDLEQQLLEKNKTIKQMQQRMLELKKTLQKELKIRPDNELFEVREKPGPEMPNMAPSVTNNTDLTDAREINFEYLKHVVLKFMSCRESEAFHLIKAVSVLLNFSQEEENMLKETLEYKMSWFGSKPAPKGSIRPSISNPRIPWS